MLGDQLLATQRFPVRHVRPAVTLAVLSTAALVLAGCGDSNTGGGKDALSSVSVSGSEAKKAPSITVKPMPLVADSTQSKVLTEGDGAAVAASDIISINIAIVNGKDGKTVDETYTAQPVGIDLGSPNLFPALKTQLPGKKLGSRVLITSPPKDAFGPEGNTGLGISGNDSVAMVVDLISSTKPLAEAEGTAVAPKAGLPTVTMVKDKPATIAIPKGAKAPTTLVNQPLIVGKGSKVASGQTVRVTYTGALWKDGSIFDASANHPQQEHFEFPAGQGRVIPGWDKSLVGQPVGSRLLLVIPPADGYGTAGSPPKISGTDTLVFVVDILAAY